MPTVIDLETNQVDVGDSESDVEFVSQDDSNRRPLGDEHLWPGLANTPGNGPRASFPASSATVVVPTSTATVVIPAPTATVVIPISQAAEEEAQRLQSWATDALDYGLVEFHSVIEKYCSARFIQDTDGEYLRDLIDSLQTRFQKDLAHNMPTLTEEHVVKLGQNYKFEGNVWENMSWLEAVRLPQFHHWFQCGSCSSLFKAWYHRWLEFEAMKEKAARREFLTTFPVDQCRICIETIKQGDEVRIECGHVFHKHCIRMNYFSGSVLCPCCRGDLGILGQQLEADVLAEFPNRIDAFLNDNGFNLPLEVGNHIEFKDGDRDTYF